MSYITTAELLSHLGVEQIEAISDGNETTLATAMDAAMVEVKSYLKAYDTVAEFAKVGAERNSLLLTFVKDVTIWHFVNSCNVNTSLTLRQERYDGAITWLRRVQKAEVAPDLPELPVAEQVDSIIFSSNPKRINHI